ncbi:MAG: hypothetical protein Q9219_005340 [cf. Caloplaca sp. 3 TL-2023]
MGNSNKCDACRKSAELHDKRHREIATLLLNVRRIDDEEQAVLSPITNGKRKTRKSDILGAFKMPQGLENIHGESEWGDSSTLNGDESDSTSLESPMLVEKYTPKRLIKAERKRARRSCHVQVITPGLMKTIDAVLHPESSPHNDRLEKSGETRDASSSKRIIEDNLAFNPNCFKLSSIRQSVHMKKLLKANGVGSVPSSKDSREDTDMISIVEQFGILAYPVHSSKERSVLMKQLWNAIRDDAEKVENENRDTMMRMAGYWRYVNRKTYNFMVRQGHVWDWTTGRKLEEIDEDDEGSELSFEDDREVEGTVWDDGSTIGNPLSGAGTPSGEMEDHGEGYELNEMKDLRLVNDDTMALDSKLDKGWPKLETCKEDCVPTTKAKHLGLDTPEYKTRIPQPLVKNTSLESPRLAFASSRKDTRHLLDPTSISTLKADEPFDSNLSVPPKALSPDTNKANLSIPRHHDPNNRYNPLSPINEGPDQRLGRSRSLRVAPAAVTSPNDPTESWTTVKGKGAVTRSTSYAGALKKKKI